MGRACGGRSRRSCNGEHLPIPFQDSHHQWAERLTLEEHQQHANYCSTNWRIIVLTTATIKTIARSKRAYMNVFFLCSPKHLQRGSTVLRARQLQQILEGPLAQSGHEAICTTDPCVRDGLVILSKGFLIDATVDTIFALKAFGNILVADYIDSNPDLSVAAEIDGFMASSHRQYNYLRSTFPNQPCHLVTHHVDQRIGRVVPPVDRLRVGYFGGSWNARHAAALEGCVEFFSTDPKRAIDRQWMSELANYNCHYGLRVVQSYDGFKPFLKGFTAAHCGAPIITEIVEGDATYYLPPDYPFFVAADDAHGVTKSIHHIADIFGGPEWRYACGAMREVRERSSVRVVIREFKALISEYLTTRHRSLIVRPSDDISQRSNLEPLVKTQIMTLERPDPPDLTEVFRTHRGRIADKWEQYLPIYDAELERFRETGVPVRLLEIGVQNGGSLEIWRKFLPHGSSVVGVDINPICASLRFDRDITVLTANAADHRSLESALGDRVFDVIIDDASHQSGEIIATFRSAFPRVAPGGLYIIEDLHAAYRHAFGGGFRMPDSAIEWLKKLIDALHVDHFEHPDLLAPEILVPLQAMNRAIGRISFYDSVAVIERLPKPKLAPWRRVTAGIASPIPAPKPNIGSLELAQGADVFLGATAAAASRRLQVAAIRASLGAAETRLANANAALTEAKLHLAEAAVEAARERARADAIEGSTIWRASAPLRHVLNRLRRI